MAASDTFSDIDRQMMRLALELAQGGRPSPNPHVGTVIVQGDQIVATGFHAKAGEDHAEVAAIKAAGARARGATMYATLEPCNHWGRTGPCTEAIIAAGIKRVVIGCADPAPHKPGATLALSAAGIDVQVGLFQDESRELIADFVKHFTQGACFVRLKAAVTLDGCLATRDGESKWITSELARTRAHALRARADAVLVGVGTVLKDDPTLNVRHVEGAQPLRVVLDSTLRTPVAANVLKAHGGPSTMIFHGTAVDSSRVHALTQAGAVLVEVARDAHGLRLSDVLTHLAKQDMVHVLVEGGAHVLGQFLEQGLADRLSLFVAPKILGSVSGQPFAEMTTHRRLDEAQGLVFQRVEHLGEDILVEAAFK